jgi:hypothetical protein
MKNDCALIEQYLFKGMIYDRRRERFHERLEEIREIIDPVYWEVGVTDPKEVLPGPGDHVTGEPVAVGYFRYRKRAGEKLTTYFRYSGPAK